MDRREFIKLMGTLSFAGAVNIYLPAVITPERPAVEALHSASGLRLRGTPDGRFLSSVDGGKTWQPAANFGSQFSVTELKFDGSQFQARLAFKNLPVDLHSSDGRFWYA